MKIGSQRFRSTAISTSDAEVINVRGHDLCEDLIGKLSFTEMVWLLIAGQTPNQAQRRLLDATLIAIAEHGLVPSVQASRMTLAAAPESLQGAVAAGILGCGSVILGAAEMAGHVLQDVVNRARGSSFENAAAQVLEEHRSARRAVPGFGHPLHKDYDPRAKRLLALAEECAVSGEHIEAALTVQRVLPKIIGKPLAMNISGAIPAVLLDAHFPLLAIKGVPILARTASLIAHLLEEQQRPIGFVLSHAAAEAIEYDGSPTPEARSPR